MEKPLDKINFVHQLLELRSGAPGNADEHSMEAVAEVNGVLYVNDSKSTSVEDTRDSIASIITQPEETLLLIVGGSDHRNDYASLAAIMRGKVKVVIYLGADNDRMLKHISKEPLLFAPAATLEEAVNYARLCTKPGDVVLFSPACSSLDPFDNYKTRGIKFRKIVNEITKSN